MAAKVAHYRVDGVSRITMRATCFDDGGFIKLILKKRGGEEVVIDIYTTAEFVAPKPIDLRDAQMPAMEAA